MSSLEASGGPLGAPVGHLGALGGPFLPFKGTSGASGSTLGSSIGVHNRVFNENYQKNKGVAVSLWIFCH